MPTVPTNNLAPEQPAPMPGPLAQIMAHAMRMQDDMSQIFLSLPGYGKATSPANVYNHAPRVLNMPEGEAREWVRKGYRGANPGITEDEIDKIEEKIPGS